MKASNYGLRNSNMPNFIRISHRTTEMGEIPHGNQFCVPQKAIPMPQKAIPEPQKVIQVMQKVIQGMLKVIQAQQKVI